MLTEDTAQYSSIKDSSGHYGIYGGCYVPETLYTPLKDLARAYVEIRKETSFWKELQADLESFSGRPTPIYHARRWTETISGAQLLLKREDLNHTGSYKINNCVGQIHLARRLGKRRIVTETGAGHHGVATAAVAARFGLECVIYMGAVDIDRQHFNVDRMHALGAKVISVTSGSRTLKDAQNEVLRDWVSNLDHSYYLTGSVTGPHPCPLIVRDFQDVIGREARRQMLSLYGRLPDVVVACVGGGSNAIGIFTEFLLDASVRLVAVEGAGLATGTYGHASALSRGSPGIFQGCKTYILQDENGQILPSNSVAAGLDYPGVGPELAWLKDCGRIEIREIDDGDAIRAFRECSRTEGIIPALESSHALACAVELANEMRPENFILVNLSGSGEKDLAVIRTRDEFAPTPSGNGK